jgi:exonuclease SbcC
MSHERTEIDFRPISVACIQGPNGAGKSAIADGILYALYGVTSRGKDDDIVRTGSQEMTVIYEFEQSGQEYRVVRKRNIAGRGKSIVEVYGKNGTPDAWAPLATGESAKDMLLRILNRDYSTFVSSSFLLQGQGEKLINSRPSERYKVVFDILGLEKYAEYKKRATSLKNRTDGQRTALVESSVDLKALACSVTDLESIREERRTLQATAAESLQEKEALLMKLSAELAVVTAKLGELDTSLEGVQALEKQKAELALRKYDLESSVRPVPQSLDEQVQKLVSELLPRKSGLQDAMEHLAELKAQQRGSDELERELRQLEQRKSVLLGSISETERHTERYRKILDNKAKIMGLVEEEKNVTAKLQTLRTESDEVQYQADALTVSLREASETETAIAKLQTVIASKEKDKEHERRTLKERIAEAEKKSSRISIAACKGEGDYVQCAFIRDAVEARSSLATLKDLLADASKLLEVPEQKEIVTLRQRLENVSPVSVKESLRKASEQANKIKADIATFEKRIEVVTTWTKQAPEIVTAEVETARACKIIDAAQAELSGIEREADSLARRKAELEAIGNSVLVAEAVIERIKIAKEIAEIQADLNELERKTTEAKREIASLVSEHQGKKASLEREITELKKAVASLKETSMSLISELSKLNTEIASCRKASEKVKAIESDISALGRRFKIYEVLEDAYERIPFYILDNVLTIMEEEANKVLEEISTTGMRLELMTEKTNKTNRNVKDTLDIIVSDIAGERPIEMYSGGEKTRQVLALAVGLAELSARKAGVKISTLLIDEPSGLDRQGLVDFGNCFIKLASQIFRKGLLMAHEESLKDIFDQKLLVRKEGTTSKVEVIF